MNRNLTAILVFMIFFLGGYVYLFETDSKENNVPITEKVEMALDFKAENVLEIVLCKNGNKVFLKRENEKWKIKGIGVPDVENKRILDLLSFFDHGIVRVIETNPLDIKQYGLDKPKYEFGIKVKGGNVFQTLIIGDDAPGNLSCYAKVKGMPRIILLGIRYRHEFDWALSRFSQTMGPVLEP